MKKFSKIKLPGTHENGGPDEVQFDAIFLDSSALGQSRASGQHGAQGLTFYVSLVLY